MLKEHSIAPLFTLPDDTDTDVSLAHHRGSWVLLYFYPKDDTPGCTKEACAFRDNFPLYETLGVTVLGISKDTTNSHRKFKEKYNLPFRLLSDTHGEVSKLYHSGVQDTLKRISYLIAPDGTIAKAYAAVDPVSHPDEVMRDLKEVTH